MGTRMDGKGAALEAECGDDELSPSTRGVHATKAGRRNVREEEGKDGEKCVAA